MRLPSRASLLSFVGLLLLPLCSIAKPAQDKKIELYGSLRGGVSIVDAPTLNDLSDGANGRDYLSRVGINASTEVAPGLIAIGRVEYGIRDENKVDFKQNGQPTLREMWIGLKSDYGTIKFGSQTNIWHSYVRSTYFSSAVDSFRQGAIRDDDLLQYFHKVGPIDFALGLQMEAQDGDVIDQYQAAIAYTSKVVKLQAAYSKDNRGENTGSLIGVRAWWYINDQLTLSGFSHYADHEYDLYAGGSFGNVFVLDGDRKIGAAKSCSAEKRSSNGVYLGYKVKQHKVGVRYDIDSCDVMGDATSVKMEYLYTFSPSFRTWVAYEVIDADTSRKPAEIGEGNFSEIQLGVRYDFKL